MQIIVQGEDDLEQALREIHRRASEYEGPLVHQFMELAKLSAPVNSDEPLVERQRSELGDDNAESTKRDETKKRFEESLSLLMLLAFPVNNATEKAVRQELNEILGDHQVKSLNMLIGNRKASLRRNLARRPTKRQVALRNALLSFLPLETENDL